MTAQRSPDASPAPGAPDNGSSSDSGGEGGGGDGTTGSATEGAAGALTSITTGTGTFSGRDDVAIHHRWWRGTPSGPAAPGWPAAPRIVIVHGVGEHAGRYEHVGRALAAAGYGTWALDHRGHGRSGGPRARVDAFEDYEADLETLRQLAATQAQDAAASAGVTASPHTVLLGHSMGGAIAVGHAIDHPGTVAGLVLTGPALQPALGVPRVAVAAGKVVARVWRGAPVLALDVEQVSRDPVVVANYRSDPLVHHGRLSAGLGDQLLRRASRFEHELAGVTVPVLLIHGTDDALVPIESSRAMAPRFGSPDVTVIEEAGLFHEVLNEPEHPRLLATIVEWLASRFPVPTHTSAPAPTAAPTPGGAP